MTFEEWWRANEKALAAEFYNTRWQGIYALARAAYEAGKAQG